MNLKEILLSFLFLLYGVTAPPVTQQKSKDDKSSENEIGDGENDPQKGALGIEYDRYLKEVVTALESDPEFREKLEKAEEVDIRNGKIAHELEYVNHNVRTKLDELKRQELERLRHLAGQDLHHLDHNNPHTFEVEDLKKLIAKTTADLAEADEKRRQEFKEYEMQKQFELEEKLKNMPEELRNEYKEEVHKMEEKHKKHEPLHHPGSKKQLEEVWEAQDHMENQEFDPKTFFYLHDLDGNGAWDEEEVKALFLQELDKLYQAGAPEDDMRERREEMERMREHVFKEADTNKDGLISYQEFLQQTQKPEFVKDEGWQSIDEQQIYSPEEYAAFEQHRQQEIHRMIQQGLIPPHPNGLPHPAMSQGHQQLQQQQHFPPVGQPVHSNQIPQVHTGQVPAGQFHGAQVQYHPGQAHQAQFQHGQIPQGQFHGNQIPQVQYYQGQAPAQFQGAPVPLNPQQTRHLPQQGQNQGPNIDLLKQQQNILQQQPPPQHLQQQPPPQQLQQQPPPQQLQQQPPPQQLQQQTPPQLQQQSPPQLQQQPPPQLQQQPPPQQLQQQSPPQQLQQQSPPQQLQQQPPPQQLQQQQYQPNQVPGQASQSSPPTIL